MDFPALALLGPWPLDLPVRQLPEPSIISSILAYPPVKVLFPVPILAAIAPAIWWFFRPTWRELDDEAANYRAALTATGSADYRPAACFVIAAIVLTMQEYFGGRPFFEEVLRGPIREFAETHPWVKIQKYDELFSYAWWSFARLVGYVLIPLPLWKLLFRE